MYVIILLALLIFTADGPRRSSISASGTSLRAHAFLESGGRAGHRLHQGHSGGAVLYACEVQHQVTKLTVGAGIFTFLVLIGMTLTDYFTRAWGRW